MSTFEIQHFKNQELAKAYMQGVHDITEWLLKPSEREATNFDRTAASPETLAKFINEIIDEAAQINSDGKTHCPFIGRCDCGDSGTCIECITQWLKKEAEEDEK